MKAILAFVALLAMVGLSVGLNPQPEPPAQLLEELGKIVITDDTLTIDLGTFPDIKTAEQNVLGAIEALNRMKITQGRIVILANGQEYPLVKNIPTVYESDDITSLLRNKI